MIRAVVHSLFVVCVLAGVSAAENPVTAPVTTPTAAAASPAPKVAKHKKHHAKKARKAKRKHRKHKTAAAH